MRARPFSLLMLMAALLVLAPSATAHCIKRHSVQIASGVSPDGLPWTVEGTIGNNGSCREWLLGMDFDLTDAIHWGWGTGIPAGSHLRDGGKVNASDDLQADGTTRVFSGSTSGQVAKVLVTLSNGKHLVIDPKAPSAQLQRRIVWLRNIRYFVTYYPPAGFVTGISTFDASGRLLYRDRSFEGF